jgi:hypothetical protein
MTSERTFSEKKLRTDYYLAASSLTRAEIRPE